MQIAVNAQLSLESLTELNTTIDVTARLYVSDVAQMCRCSRSINGARERAVGDPIFIERPRRRSTRPGNEDAEIDFERSSQGARDSITLRYLDDAALADVDS